MLAWLPFAFLAAALLVAIAKLWRKPDPHHEFIFELCCRNLLEPLSENRQPSFSLVQESRKTNGGNVKEPRPTRGFARRVLPLR